MAVCYRITKRKYADDLSGFGAAMFGGRWNSVSTPMVYTSGSIALATLEVLAHVAHVPILEPFMVVTYNIPDSIEVIDVSFLPYGWDDYPAVLATKKMGDKFVADGKFLALKVPSAIIPEEFNYVINPKHKFANDIVITSKKLFTFDKRLV